MNSRLRILSISSLIWLGTSLLNTSSAVDPGWWQNAGIIDANAAANNLGPANIGQMKNMAKGALAALQPKLSPSHHEDLAMMLSMFVNLEVPPNAANDPVWKEKQRAPLLLGQLKAVAARFYDKLNYVNPEWLGEKMAEKNLRIPLPTDPVTYSPYPWTETEADDQNKAVATIGQLKAVFSLPFESLPNFDPNDIDGDGLPNDWETDNGLDPEDRSDGGSTDSDADGLTNVEEFEAGTNPRIYDTDGDGFGDEFELLNPPDFDPLTPNVSVDTDGDGISDYEESLRGTNPLVSDSDGDGTDDLDEINLGSNPSDPGRKPFNFADYVGPPTNGTSVSPIGNLGVNYSRSNDYEVSFTLNDVGNYGYDFWGILRLRSEQEAWRLSWGDGSYNDTSRTYPFATSGTRTLDGRRIYVARLHHLGVCGPPTAPGYEEEDEVDYNHMLNITSVGYGFHMITNEPFVPQGGFAINQYPTTIPGYLDWRTRENYLIPVSRITYSSSYSGGDATGPHFRKVSLFGLPIPDAKPESETESDEEAENSYVDAFDLTLQHSTSFVSVPLAASELRLEANASVRETSWSNRHGLRPSEELTSPFGVGWTSNLCSYIEIVETLGDSSTRPTVVNVVDEGGNSQRFGTKDQISFFPWPSSFVDKKSYLNRLSKESGDLVLRKPFGNQLTYRLCSSWFMYSSDRVEDGGSATVKKHTYWRLMEVKDRYDEKVVYEYGLNNSDDFSLIPSKIQAVGRPGQRLVIERSSDGKRVESITDARDNVVTFHYPSSPRNIAIDGTSFNYDYYTLDKVTYPGDLEEFYEYDVVSDSQTVNNNTTYYFHANVSSMQREGRVKKKFHYDFDRTKKWYNHVDSRYAFNVSLSSLPGPMQERAKESLKARNKTVYPWGTNETLHGIPRRVTRVEWVGKGMSAYFAKTAETETNYKPEFSAASGTLVTDVNGRKYEYAFGEVEGEIIDQATDFDGGSVAASAEWLVYYKKMTLKYKTSEGTLLGQDEFEFEPRAGFALKKAIDFCGNTTEWTFDSSRPVTPRIKLSEDTGNTFLSKWSDPTSKTDALGRVETYEYGDFRVMTESVDVNGTTTTCEVDNKGRRKKLIVEGASGQKLKEETYVYDDEDGGSTDFAGFMVQKTVVNFSNLPDEDWDQSLVTRYIPDAFGRVHEEIVDPGSGPNLVTTYGYDLNNNKTSVKDPRNNTTTFVFDPMNRVEEISHPDGEDESIVYDDSGSKIREIDERGISTFFGRDDFGRVTSQVRDFDANGVAGGGDISTHTEYNNVGQVTRVTDPRGTSTVTFYDELYRPSHIFGGVSSSSAYDLGGLTGTAAGSRQVTHQEISYDKTKNCGGGLLQASNSTSTVRRDAVSSDLDASGDRSDNDLTLSAASSYDDVYRLVHSSVQYDGSTARNVTTHDYNGLVTTVTDDHGKITRTTMDGMGREKTVVDAEGTALETTKTTYYSATGLAWKSVLSLGAGDNRTTKTEYDGAGRPVRVWQSDPGSGDVTQNSPEIETEYDGNGNITTVRDALERATVTEYDSRNRPWRTTFPAVTDARNPAAPVASVQGIEIKEYDQVGNLIAVTDTLGAITRTFYDRANRPIATRTNPVDGTPSDDLDDPDADDITIRSVLDKGGLVLTAIDGNGTQTRNSYDRQGRLIATLVHPTVAGEPDLEAALANPSAYRSGSTPGILVTNTYDDSGNLLEVTDGKGQVTAFTYDGANRKTRTIWDYQKAAEKVETTTYDALVRTSSTDGMERLTIYNYDELYRLTEVVYNPVQGTSTHPDNREYHYTRSGQIEAVEYPNDPGSLREVSYTYDKLERITSETSAGVTHGYTSYDKAGNRLVVTYGRTGRTLVSSYDNLNRLLSCQERDSATVPSSRFTNYAYDLEGNVTRKTLPNGNSTTNTYDFLGRTLTMTERKSGGAVVSAFDYSVPVAPWPYSRDAVGNVLRCEETYSRAGVSGRTVENVYDRTSRLLTETITPSGQSSTSTFYSYDLANNRKTKIQGGSTTEYVFGDGANGANSNQLISYGPSGQTATHSFTYDGNGNRATRVTSAGTDTYAWDFENRLATLELGGGATYHYDYDYRGRRVVRDESDAAGSSTILTFSGGQSVQEADEAGTVQVELIRGSDWGGGVGGLLYSLRSGTRSYNAYNSRGDVVSTSDASGAATWQAAYEAFGTRTGEDGVNQERQRANTKEEDPTGLLNEGHRYRDLEAGVFISRDPAGFVDGPNVYTYVKQNPWSAFDPEGLWFWDDYKRMREVAKLEGGWGGSVRAMGNSAYNDTYGEVEQAATQGAYLANQMKQSGSGAGSANFTGVSYAAYAMIGGKDIQEGGEAKELTFTADGGIDVRDLTPAEVKGKVIGGTLKLGTTVVGSVSGGIGTARGTSKLGEKVVEAWLRREARGASRFGVGAMRLGELEGLRPRLIGSFHGMTPKAAQKLAPKGWKRMPADRGNGWKLVDENGIERIRFMRETGNPTYSHRGGYWRRQDSTGNFLNEAGDAVDMPDPSKFPLGKADPAYKKAVDDFEFETHIPYTGNE